MLLRNPHLLVASTLGFVDVEELRDAADGEMGAAERVAEDEGLRGFGTSKICKLPLSDVQANMFPDGLKRKEKIVAFSLPRLRSANFAPLPVAKIRTSVPW